MYKIKKYNSIVNLFPYLLLCWINSKKLVVILLGKLFNFNLFMKSSIKLLLKPIKMQIIINKITNKKVINAI